MKDRKGRAGVRKRARPGVVRSGKAYLIGYARVSTDDQDMRLQVDALDKAKCDKIYREKISGAASTRPEFHAALAQLRPGDTLVVWKIDRLGRSQRDLLNLYHELTERKINIRCLTGDWDYRTPYGKMVAHMMMLFAELERDLIRERTWAGQQAAKRRGARFGRLPLHPSKMRQIPLMLREQTGKVWNPVKEVASALGIHRATVYRYRNASTADVASSKAAHAKARQYRRQREGR